ncbi:hypothetical protein DI09_68p70 [Mitosporidium daphniae]|uniref:Uncharacterized protein n=1 Tax=Mitosporidium daphniae TaxID=1485682 RepID=A0A098VNX7_9MICR|nr:uncharacterized protein DI09_68p70 [Mitosporidium daphniae]KGG50499.1 hypothetical protein DI09_68p70 [Mitosporidium daphniae]|eukprot:XP_013236946.1 uncharacterized protein DI09_68p70 [Mitosporidium daphniae]
MHHENTNYLRQAPSKIALPTHAGLNVNLFEICLANFFSTFLGIRKGTVKKVGKGVARDAGKGVAGDAGKGVAGDAGKGVARDAGKGVARDAGKANAESEPMGAGLIHLFLATFDKALVLFLTKLVF